MAKKVKGRKRHLGVDSLGLIWAVRVTAASVPEREGAKRLIPQMEAAGDRLKTIYADGGYAGHLEDVFSYFCGWNLQIINKLPDQKGFVLLPKRWVVERTFAWLYQYRRLSKDYEFEPDSGEAMIRWAMINKMVRTLAPAPT